MAAHGARRLGPMTDNLFRILGIELFCGVEGVRFRAPIATSPALQRVMDAFYKAVPPLDVDRFMGGDLEMTEDLVRRAQLLSAAELDFPELESQHV